VGDGGGEMWVSRREEREARIGRDNVDKGGCRGGRRSFCVEWEGGGKKMRKGAQKRREGRIGK